MNIKVFAFIICLNLLSSCAYYDEKNPLDPSLITTSNVSWQKLSTEFFQPRCAICHGNGEAGINVSDYNEVVKSLSRVKQATVTRKNMPPDSPLTPYEKTLISTWISVGAPY